MDNKNEAWNNVIYYLAIILLITMGIVLNRVFPTYVRVQNIGQIANPTQNKNCAKIIYYE